MKKILLLLILLISASSFAADVTGKVFLDNGATYENCTITFTPVSPSAVLAQTTSQLDGSFTANIANGVYNIKYEKNGYQIYELLNYFINDTVILNDVTLSSNILVLVNGNVSGAWTKGHTYRVTGNIIVPAGQTLTIEEGVEVKFDGYYSLTVNGTLLANGSADKYVQFTSNKTSPTNKDWDQIVVNGISKMDYCIIEYGKAKNDDNIGLLNVTGNLTLTNSKIRNSEQSAISIRNAGIITVQNNKIYNCAYGFSVYTTGKVIIENNEIYNHVWIGINIYQASTSSIFKNNIIHDCIYQGIQSIEFNYKIERNIIFNTGTAIFVTYGQPTIINNTLIYNQHGIGLYDNPSIIPNPIISSNIISNNRNYAIYSMGNFKPQSVSYNLFYNNGSGTGNLLPVGVGTVVTTNKNNTPADAYYNIFENPDFESITLADETFCILKSNSPAVDAGDPSIIASKNGTIVDIGAREIGGVLSNEKFTNSKLSTIKVFPNPTTNYLSFETNQDTTFDSITFFDINGKAVDQIKLTNSVSEYQWKVSQHLAKGVYLYSIMNGNKTIDSGKFIKK